MATVTAERRTPPARALGGPWLAGRRGDLLVGGLLVAAFWLFELQVLSLPLPSDMLRYLNWARDFPAVEASHGQLRVGLILPVRAAIELFGYGQAAYYAFPLLTGCLLLVSTYALGVRLFGRWAGAGAAVTLCLYPSVASLLSHPLPDIPATALFVTALAVLAWAPARVDAARRRSALLVVAGLLLGWSYLARETMVLVFPVVALVLGARRRSWPDWFVLMLPLVTVLAGETLLNAVIHGDPLARLAASAGRGGAEVAPEVAATYRDLPRHVYITRLPSLLLDQRFGPAWLLLFGGGLLGGLSRDRGLRLCAAWFLVFWVPMTLLGGVLDPSAPLLRLQLIRYWFPVLPALALAAFGALRLIGVRMRAAAPRISIALARRPALAAVLPWLLVVSIAVLGGARQARDAADNGLAAAEWFRDWVREDGQSVDRIWSDGRSSLVLRVFAHEVAGGPVWNGTFAAYDDVEEPLRSGGENDALVFFSIGTNACPRCRKAAQDVFPDPEAPGPSWRLADRSPDGSVLVYTR